MGRHLGRLPVEGREEDVAGIERLMTKVDPDGTSPVMEVTVTVQVDRQEEEDLQAVAEEVEAPKGVAQEGTRVARGAHRGTMIPFWRFCAQWEK